MLPASLVAPGRRSSACRQTDELFGSDAAVLPPMTRMAPPSPAAPHQRLVIRLSFVPERAPWNAPKSDLALNLMDWHHCLPTPNRMLDGSERKQAVFSNFLSFRSFQKMTIQPLIIMPRYHVCLWRYVNK